MLAKFNDNNRFLKACAEKYTDIVSGTNGQNGQNGTSVSVDDVRADLAADLSGDSIFIGNVAEVIPAGKSAAEIWCEAHTLSATENVQPIALSPSQIMKSIISQGDDVINKDMKLFASMAVCLDAVAANPDLMSGESTADQEFNEIINKEGRNIAEIDPNEFTIHHEGFINNMKAELKGANGTNGLTFRPSIDASTGLITWTAGSNTSNTSFDISAPAVNAVKADLNVASGTTLSDALNTNAVAAVKNSIDASASNLQSAIDARATTKANTQINSLSNQLLTVQDFVNLINSGIFKVNTSDNKLTLDTTIQFNSNSDAYDAVYKLRTNGADNLQLSCGGTLVQQGSNDFGQCTMPAQLIGGGMNKP